MWKSWTFRRPCVTGQSTDCQKKGRVVAASFLELGWRFERGTLPADADAGFGACAIRDGVRFAYPHFGRQGLGVVPQDVLRRFQHEGLFELELRPPDELLEVVGKLGVVNGMHQVVVTGGLRKVKPDGNVQYNRLLLFSLERERSDNAIERQVF